MTDASPYDQIQARRWFYDFDLPDGSHTRSYLVEAVAPIHQTRLEMLFGVLDPIVQDRWPELSAIDVACHQGYFAINLARRGCGRVVAVDARADHVADARLMARAYGLDNIHVEERDVTQTSAGDLGAFDIVVLFGLLYHVEDPIGLLRFARGLTRRVCVVETQVAPEGATAVDWGTRLVQRPVMGSFCVIDETGEPDGPESGLTGISLCPSLDALVWVLQKVGFSRVERVTAPPGAYEQHASGARVVVAGFVE
jgi:tRNA (mo5U34)-methyltransferase